MTTDFDTRPTARILVVEHETPLRRLMTRVLAGCGYATVDVANGMEALALLERDPQTYTLVITGIIMPVLDGLELHRMMRRRGLTIPVLFVSGFTAIEVAGEVRGDSRTLFLSKPWTLDELQGKVREILASPGHPADQAIEVLQRP